jgi:cystathionine beta-lyase family protein involved in aluminum resistance
MRLPQIINEAMAIPKSQAIVDAGTMISGMILNLLSDAKIRLYRILFINHGNSLCYEELCFANRVL